MTDTESFRIRRDLLDRARVLAKKDQRTIQATVERILRSYFKEVK